MKYSHRYIARFTIEAETPLSVGSGEKGLIIDRLIAKDANGLPYIPGTSLTGVLRHSFSDKPWINEIFGYGGKDGTGSRLIISSAILIGEDGKTVMEGLRNINWNSPYYSYFNRLPERDHVRINHKGAADAENHGKYDEELVHKGTRFVFEIELIGDEEDKDRWNKIIAAFSNPTFRIGAGTRKGFGKLKIIKNNSKTKTYKLKEGDLKTYLQKSSSLKEDSSEWSGLPETSNSKELQGWQEYILKIKPVDFFLFGAGFGDEDADNKPKTERYFEWASGKPQLTEKEFLLIPATSVKGALAHRIAYYYNQEKEQFIGKIGVKSLKTPLDTNEVLQELEKEFSIEGLSFSSQSSEWERLEEKIQNLTINDLLQWNEFKHKLDIEVQRNEESLLPIGENNEAVKTLFGFAKDSEDDKSGLRGSVILNDCFLPYSEKEDKVFNHTKIDRFTNGTIDSALFQEKASQYKQEFELNIWVDKSAFEKDETIKVSFEKALDDLINGRLSLGGHSSKGHGIFQGTLIKTNDEEN